MAYDARVLEVMIASPSDVPEERQIVWEVVTEWNVLHSRDRNVVLMPIGWETHSAPDLSGRPQQIINDRVLAHADILVGIFWTRLGSPTGKAASGTVEEIDEHLAKGRPVMLYFSNTPVVPDSLDPEQYAKLQELKNWARNKGLIEIYSSKPEFQNLLRRQLSQALNRLISEHQPDLVQIYEQARDNNISLEALELLVEATKDRDGIVMHREYINAEDISTNGRQFNDDTARSIALWTDAVEEL